MHDSILTGMLSWIKSPISNFRRVQKLSKFNGEDGLDIVLEILDAAPDYLKQKGVLIVEVGESAETLQEILPRVPFLWLDFQDGGDGIFLLEYDQLIAYRSDVRAVLEHRKHV